ncbi:hypothetical protein BDY19DRAFT_770952 [Irpex rosettiformis]|uniref:Uncharacterized protein n=1 Tax=Irpex rosettiformis TaxID=378272 RepID=A0ACB8U810_9APHY|nr:hypothetical protein BDY19DRAFT_770952 [Irpex rosettiformis]
MSITKLPLYPSSRARDALPPSQQATLNDAIASTLHQILELPQEKRDKSSCVAFIASYAKDHAQRNLNALIWELNTSSSGKPKRYTQSFSKVERLIHERTFKLAHQLITSISLEPLIDLAVVYGPSNPKRFRALLLSASKNPSLVRSIETEAGPAFTDLLNSSTQGLYGLCKISYILLSFLHTAPPDLVRPLARNKPFVLSLAKAYDFCLSACANAHGGIRPERVVSETPLDDWERIFLETKVSLIDSFHVLLRVLLKDVEELREPGHALAERCEAAFDIVFGLIDLPSSSSSSANDITPVPFLNQTLLADYQHTYGLSRIIAEVTRRADDPRTELLESTLQNLDGSVVGGGGRDDSSRPGALKLLLRSSGVQTGIDNRGTGKGPSSSSHAKGKGKAKVLPPIEQKSDPALDTAVAQVLDVLPDTPPDYVRFLLAHQDYPYKGNAERLVEALFDGTAPNVNEVERLMSDRDSGLGMVEDMGRNEDTGKGKGREGEFVYTRERRNVFDDEVMDVSQLRVGKKRCVARICSFCATNQCYRAGRDDAQTILQDRAYIEQMKADILRRAEEISDEEDDDDDGDGMEGRGKGMVVAFEDELDDGALKVRDGEESQDEGSEDETDDDAKPETPETILELAYIADPKVFDRDAQTRRSKARDDLRRQTGWADEQIEGWRIMLERDPNKDKILQKHEFSGNKRGLVPLPVRGPSQPPSNRGRGYGRGRGGGRGRGRGGRGGRGGGGGSGSGSGGNGGSGGGDSTARDRAYKDKNKAQRGNHNRKSGHDKKMARAAGPS